MYKLLVRLRGRRLNPTREIRTEAEIQVGSKYLVETSWPLQMTPYNPVAPVMYVMENKKKADKYSNMTRTLGYA